jgi:hypothetical protein
MACLFAHAVASARSANLPGNTLSTIDLGLTGFDATREDLSEHQTLIRRLAVSTGLSSATAEAR